MFKKKRIIAELTEALAQQTALLIQVRGLDMLELSGQIESVQRERDAGLLRERAAISNSRSQVQELSRCRQETDILGRKLNALQQDIDKRRAVRKEGETSTLLSDLRALQAESHSLEQKLARAQSEIDGAMRTRMLVEKQLESAKEERDLALQRAAAAEADRPDLEHIIATERGHERRLAMRDARIVLEAVKNAVVCKCGNIRNAGKRQCFVCKRTEVIPLG